MEALSLRALRYQDFIPVLLRIRKECRAHLLDFEKELKRFIYSLPDDKIKDKEKTLQGLKEFVEFEDKYGNLEAWDFPLFPCIDFYNFRTGEEYMAKDIFIDHTSLQSYYCAFYESLF